MGLREALDAILDAPAPVVRGFRAPDSGGFVPPYTCSFHWLRTAGGRILGLDMVRSDDTGELILRAFRERPEGGLDGLLHAAPRQGWGAFLVDPQADLDVDADGAPTLLRQPGRVAGRVCEGAGALREVRFDLDIEGDGYGLGALSLEIDHLSVYDYRHARYTGHVILDGERYEIDGPGAASVHYGAHLCRYAYLASVPRTDQPEADGLLGASIGRDDLRVGEDLLGERCLTYAWGYGHLPLFSVQVSTPEPGSLPIGRRGQVQLSEIQACDQRFLGVHTWTGTAMATYQPGAGAPLPLGRVVFDHRGDAYVSSLQRAGGMATSSA